MAFYFDDLPLTGDLHRRGIAIPGSIVLTKPVRPEALRCVRDRPAGHGQVVGYLIHINAAGRPRS